MSGEMVPPQYSPSNAARSFTIRGRAKCPRRRARSFDEGVTVSRPNAVGRDGVVNLFALCKFCPFLLNADSWQPKINASNRNGGDCKCNHRRFSYSLFLVFPSRLPFPRGTFAHRSRPRKGRLAKSAVLTRRVIKSRVNAVPRDIFCSAPPLGCGSGHALSKSFASFCASRNAQVPLRYTSQPFRRKIYAKSFAQCFVITFI